METITEVKILHLNLQKKWYNMIESGEKKEEYREIKVYWLVRLLGPDEKVLPFTHVEFKNGYQKNARTMTWTINGEIKTGFGREEWGAIPGYKYFVIKLGEKL
jgi:hypothetical protein